MSTYFYYFMVLALILLTPWLAFRLIAAEGEVVILTEELSKTSDVNPWKSQLMLMLKSGQTVANYPTVNKGSMLYGALIMEELAETLIGLAKGIEQVSLGKGSELYKLSVHYVQVAKILSASSLSIRSQIAGLSEHPLPKTVSLEVAREILDGVTDLHVVVAGLGLACGLPGQAAYQRVSSSNLSKANPVSGMIDKDSTGKWIKGQNYKEPELDDLIRSYYPSQVYAAGGA